MLIIYLASTLAIASLLGTTEPTYKNWNNPIGKENVITIEKSLKCNCYLYQKELFFPNLPHTEYILNNLQSNIGSLAVFYYPNSGLHHYAKVTWTNGYSFETNEANFKYCEISKRILNLDYPRLIGFYHN